MRRKISNHFPLLFFLLSVFLLLMYKWAHLSLPFFQDEAWVYGKAVRMMADKSLSLLPNALDDELVRGHPLLFHFIFAAILKVLGNSVFNAHLIALGVSVSFLFLLFYYFETRVGRWSGWVLTSLVMIQPVFLAQCGLVLPEILLALLLFLSIWFFSEGRFRLYFYTAACAVLVKESAAVLFVALTLLRLYNFKKLASNFSSLPLHLFKINLPLIPWILYLIVCKLQTGNFFFHEHIEALSFHVTVFFDKLMRGFYFVFLAQGRNIFFLASLLSVVLIAFRNELKKLNFVSSYVLFIFLFLIFSSVNYYADRYLLMNVVFFIMLTVAVIQFNSTKLIFRFCLFIFCFSAAVFSLFTQSSGNDHNSGYVNAVQVNVQGINFLKKKLSREDTIYCWFNTHRNLQSHYAGYLESDYYFRNLTTGSDNVSRYYIFTDIENADEKKQFEKKYGLISLVRYQQGNSWFEVMKKP